MHALALYAAMVVETEQACRLRDESAALGTAQAECLAFVKEFGDEVLASGFDGDADDIAASDNINE